MKKPILCIDFDGVLHSYSSGWQGADVVSDAPVVGAMRFLWDAAPHFTLAVYSSRSNQNGGRRAMQGWLNEHFRTHWAADRTTCEDILAAIQWPTEKPPAFVTLDDRAITFEGEWPDPQALLGFQPWNKRHLGATGRFSMPALNESDQGELKMGVAYDKLDGLVRVEFGKPVAWLAMPPEDAVAFAQSLLRHAASGSNGSVTITL